MRPHPTVDTISPTDADDVEQCFEEARRLQPPCNPAGRAASSTHLRDDSYDDEDIIAISPPPRRPVVTPRRPATTSTPQANLEPSSVRELHLPMSSVWTINSGLWHSPWRNHVVAMLIVGALVVACWERQIFDSLANSEADPPLVVAALVLGKAWCCALVLLVAHTACGSLGTAPERFLFSRWLVFMIALTSFFATATGAYALSVMSWSSAVILNPMASAPLFFLVLSRLVGCKRLPRSAMMIVCVTLVAMSVALIRGIAGHSMTTDDGRHLGEAAGCLLCLVSGALLGTCLALWERCALQYPTSPLYLTCVTSFIEVVLLPTIMLVDMIPIVGSSATATDAVGRFFSLHRDTIPLSMIGMVGAHAAVYAIVFPLLVRAPSLMVPLFSLGPLLAAGVYPGPALSVVLGGAYAVMVVILLLASEAEYNEDRIVIHQSRVKIRRAVRQQGGHLWQHGASIICWRPSAAVVEPRDLWRNAFLVAPSMSRWTRACLEWSCIAGWLPLSAAFPLDVKYSSALLKATRRDRYGYSVIRLSGLISDE